MSKDIRKLKDDLNKILLEDGDFHDTTVVKKSITLIAKILTLFPSESDVEDIVESAISGVKDEILDEIRNADISINI